MHDSSALEYSNTEGTYNDEVDKLKEQLQIHSGNINANYDRLPITGGGFRNFLIFIALVLHVKLPRRILELYEKDNASLSAEPKNEGKIVSETTEKDNSGAEFKVWLLKDKTGASAIKITETGKIISHVVNGKELVYYAGDPTQSVGYEVMSHFDRWTVSELKEDASINLFDGTSVALKKGEKVIKFSNGVIVPVKVFRDFGVKFDAAGEDGIPYHGIARKIKVQVDGMGEDGNGSDFTYSVDTEKLGDIWKYLGKFKYTVTYRLGADKLGAEIILNNNNDPAAAGFNKNDPRLEVLAAFGFHPFWLGSASARVPAGAEFVPLDQKKNLISDGKTKGISGKETEVPLKDNDNYAVVYKVNKDGSGRAVSTIDVADKGYSITLTQENMNGATVWVETKRDAQGNVVSRKSAVEPTAFAGVGAQTMDSPVFSEKDGGFVQNGLFIPAVKPGKTYKASIEIKVDDRGTALENTIAGTIYNEVSAENGGIYRINLTELDNNRKDLLKAITAGKIIEIIPGEVSGFKTRIEAYKAIVLRLLNVSYLIDKIYSDKFHDMKFFLFETLKNAVLYGNIADLIFRYICILT